MSAVKSVRPRDHRQVRGADLDLGGATSPHGVGSGRVVGVRPQDGRFVIRADVHRRSRRVDRTRRGTTSRALRPGRIAATVRQHREPITGVAKCAEAHGVRISSCLRSAGWGIMMFDRN